MSTTLSNAALRSSSSIVAKSSKNALLGSTRSMAGGKEIRFGVEGRAAMLRGVDLMADAVQVSDIVYYLLYDDIYYYFSLLLLSNLHIFAYIISTYHPLQCSHIYTLSLFLLWLTTTTTTK